MKRFILVMTLLFSVFSFALRAEEEAPANTSPLPFWGIDLKDFYADTPRPISVPGAGGVLNYYWYWTFQFKFVTNLEELKSHYEKMATKLETAAVPEEAKMLHRNIARLESTIKEIKYTKFNAIIYTGNGEMIPDNSNSVIRNLVEREAQRKLYTTKEISHLNLPDVPITNDPKYGDGRWVYGVAIFNNLPEDTRKFEIRVSGLGKRILPMYMPGRLFYPADTLSITSAIRPTMRRSLRYFYTKIGQGPELAMTPVRYETRKAEWIWIWPMQIYAGRFREINVERTSGLKRRYIYAPYYIWNNTHLPQPVTVVKAGFIEDITWGGEKLNISMLDDGGTDARWKLQALDVIRQRLDSGEEKEFIAEHETYPVKYTSVNMEDYYREKLKLDYIPAEMSEAEAEDLRQKLTTSDRVIKLTEELDKRKEEDVERKVKYMPADPERARLYSGTIEPGKIVTGVFIVRWGVDDLNETLDQLITQMQSQALMAFPADDRPLLAAYYKLLKPSGNVDAPWTRPADPTRDVILKMLLEQAKIELSAKSIEVIDDDVQRYGGLAPLGALFNYLAWEKLNQRAEKSGVTDCFFEVKTTSNANASETASINCHYQRYLPTERLPLASIPDKFKDEGTKAGISEKSRKKKEAAAGEAAGEDGTGEKENEPEELW